MQALSMERNICEGEREVKELFDFVSGNAEKRMAYQLEQDIFERVMKIGLAAMKGYFAAKGTGDVGETLVLKDGNEVVRGNDLSLTVDSEWRRICSNLHGRIELIKIGNPGSLPNAIWNWLIRRH